MITDHSDMKLQPLPPASENPTHQRTAHQWETTVTGLTLVTVKLNQLMTSEKNSKNSSADGLKNPGKCFGKARRHRFCKLHGVFDDHTRRRIFQELCMLQQLGITGLEVCPLGALARSFWRNYCRNKNPRGQHNGKDGKLKIFCNDNLSHCLAI